ncbi:hypothetical protein [Spirosoma endophyticum]|uniref:Uncharacterized protein n=1 Tax=Spirosoma endophyticum TaxID=662367 RepID=A0A1I2GT75_9BACT|nr:hypothetical protein [Spirosoma endophyticum]SFF20249.1 hypothetical protein SAMN05216167_1352 [Spirosoma endophyticum]
MKKTLIGLIPVVLLLACNRGQDDPQANPIVTAVLATIPQKLSTNDPSLVDRPQFGDVNTIRQAPYGLSPKRTGQLRLQSILFNGRLSTEYLYDAQDRLIEKKTYYNDGHIYESTRFSYQPTGTIRMEYWPNKNAISGEGYPSNNDVVLNASTTFTTTSSGAELVKTTQRGPNNNNTNYPQEYRFGFNSSGQLVWIEQPNPHGLSGDYTLYVRDQQGNAIKTKYVRLVQTDQNSTTIYHFDQRKNPYYTTGDPTDDRATNTNNIVLEESSFGSGLKTSYNYEYRPDGYPSKVNYTTASQGPIIQEFIYNK